MVEVFKMEPTDDTQKSVWHGGGGIGGVAKGKEGCTSNIEYKQVHSDASIVKVSRIVKDKTLRVYFGVSIWGDLILQMFLAVTS